MLLRVVVVALILCPALARADLPPDTGMATEMGTTGATGTSTGTGGTSTGTGGTPPAETTEAPTGTTAAMVTTGVVGTGGAMGTTAVETGTTAAATGTGGTDTGVPPPEYTPCGCRSDGGAGGWALGLGLALLWRRRR